MADFLKVGPSEIEGGKIFSLEEDVDSNPKSHLMLTQSDKREKEARSYDNQKDEIDLKLNYAENNIVMSNEYDNGTTDSYP